MLDTMDTTVQPCDDFYNFACGGFIKKTLISDEQISVSTFFDRMQIQLLSVISEERKPDEPKPFTLVKDIFRGCMNTQLIEKRGIEPLKAISDSMGGWPVVKGDSWDEQSSWTWLRATQLYRWPRQQKFTAAKNSSKQLLKIHVNNC